ncbi:MAG: serine/threonine protein kinase [Paracoccaceae bacterium]
MNSGPHKDNREENVKNESKVSGSDQPLGQEVDDDEDKTVLSAGPVAALPKAPVDHPPIKASAGTISQTQSPGSIVSGKLPPGTLINNNYEITEELNAGGMGEVYRGINIHGGPPVAIKAILQEKAEDSEAGLLFKREAMTLSHLVDETIVRYYNYVHDKDLNRYFLVMEFIDGMPLKDHVAQNGPLSAEEAKILIARLAGGLSKAHAQGVFHRDLSPDNIMLVGGLVAEARIIDFGIAKSSVFTEGTMHGRFAGKLKYVAPEQLGHFGGIIGPGTDIYGLALLVCAAAIGKALPMGSTMVDAVESRRRIPDLSALAPELRPLLSYMLEPDPADRPPSMEAVRKMVETPTEIPAEYLQGWTPPVAPVESVSSSDETTAGTGPSVTGTTGSFVGLQTPGQMSFPDQTTQRERPTATCRSRY